VVDDVMARLKTIYTDAGDTTLIQNSALRALTRLRNDKATDVFKELILLDPPAFEERDEYAGLFSAYEDSLKLAARLFPEILNLTTIEDFKLPVRALLASLTDSNYVKPEVYEDYVGNIYFDAKIALKKIQNANEISSQNVTDEDSEYSNNNRYAGSYSQDMDVYVNLLAPYYDKNPNLPAFFNKLLSLNNEYVKMSTALALVKQNKPVADSVWTGIAKNKAMRNLLAYRLARRGKEQLMPAQYRSDAAMAEAALYGNVGNRLDTLVQLDKRALTYKGRNRTVYFYKYKVTGDDTWKMALSSVLKGERNRGNDELFRLSGKKLASGAALKEQQDEELRKLIVSQRDSGRQFYRNDSDMNQDIPMPAME